MSKYHDIYYTWKCNYSSQNASYTKNINIKLYPNGTFKASNCANKITGTFNIIMINDINGIIEFCRHCSYLKQRRIFSYAEYDVKDKLSYLIISDLVNGSHKFTLSNDKLILHSNDDDYYFVKKYHRHIYRCQIS